MTFRGSLSSSSDSSRGRKRQRRNRLREEQRRLLLETLEDRRLLALGPQLGGIQPTDGNLLNNGDVRDVAPNDLTIRFDRDQQIDPTTLGGIQVIRSGKDGTFNDGNEVTILPGFIGVNAAPKQNEVVLRFKESLPDDHYQIRIIGTGANALRNNLGQAFNDLTNDGLDNGSDFQLNFELDLAPQVLSVVPQPVRRTAAGTLQQERNVIEVYFNDDDLLIVNDSLGNPTRESAENPDFYQLIFTADTVRNTDDVVVKPARVRYNAVSDMARLEFGQNLDELINPDTGSVIGPGTFRLRIGTDESAPLEPQHLSPVVQVATDFNTIDNVIVQFTAVRAGEDGISLEFVKNDQGGFGLPIVSVVGKTVSVDLNTNAGNETTAQQLVDAINRHPEARRLVVASIISDPGSANTNIASPPINYSPLNLVGMGSSFDTATDISDDTDLGPVLVVTGAGNAFVDGEFFFIEDSSGVQRKFEFDSDSPSAKNDQSAVAILFNASQSQSRVSQQIVSAINNASFGVTARLAGNRIELEGDRKVDLSDGVPGLTKQFKTKFDLGSVLVVTGDGTTYVDGQTLTVTDANGLSKSFEFDAGTRLILPAGSGLTDSEKITIDDGSNPPIVFEFENLAAPNGITGDVAIGFLASDNQATITTNVLAAIQGRITAGQLDGNKIKLVNLGSGRLHLGFSPSVNVTIAATNITKSQQAGVAASAFAVPFLPFNGFTVNDVAASLADAVNRASASTAFTVIATSAGNRVRFDSDSFISLGTVSAGIQQTIQSRFDTGPVLVVNGSGDTSGGDPDAFRDGQTLRIVDDRGVSRLFEFDNSGALVDPSAIRIPFTAADNQAAIAKSIATAINGAGFRVRATLDGIRIYLTNDRDIVLGPTLKGLSKTSLGIIISAEISAQPFPFDFPGSSSEPGHRDIPEEVGSGVEQHINPEFGADVTPGVTTIFYNFKSAYDSSNPSLQNVITDRQKQRAREAFQLWSDKLGVQFLETASEGITVVTGLLSSLNPAFPDVQAFPTQGYRVRIDPRFGSSMLIMDAARQWDDEFGGVITSGNNSSWFINAMRGIGTMLGLGLASDLPATTIMAFGSTRFPNEPTPEPIFPGNQDIVHGQFLHRPDGVDVDMYKFTIDLDEGKNGLFTAETFAERRANASLLDTVLRLYRENADGTRELLAQNDDYYSSDSYIEVPLAAGTYYIGVSASGNASYDPAIENTGIGGTSQGLYDLRLNFRSQVDDEATIRDRFGAQTPIDGDSNGTPGGIYNFWFQTQKLDRTIDITSGGSAFPTTGQVLTVTNSTGVVRKFELTKSGAVGAGNTPVLISNGDSPQTIAGSLATAINNLFIGTQKFVTSATASGATITLQGERYVTFSLPSIGVRINGRTIFVDKTAGPNADGSQAHPFNNLAFNGVTNAFANTHPGDIVRIVGNGGFDNNIGTVADNFAYEIGFSTLNGATLADGSTMEIPRGVTTMIEPGTIFKLRQARIGVGSSTLGVDRSRGALQVLGTPKQKVIFTSWLDESIGRDTHPPTTTPAAGDWGGLVFRADLDNAESRFNYEDEGVFLNYVNNADIRYGGGGNVKIDSIQQIVNPIQMIQARPTVSFNSITFSADAAMSADPNSFEETNFHSPRYQRAGQFTSDYSRIGPDIHGNFVAMNSTNGLFIRVITPAGNATRTLTVPGRFDDTDIVHVLAENLQIQGSQGEPFLDLSRAPINLITFTPQAGGGLISGVQYSYKLVFVDGNGFEGRPSNATISTTLPAGMGSIRLSQLPPATGDFVARRIYRESSTNPGVFTLVAQINASDSIYVDTGVTAGGVLQRDPPAVASVTLAPVQRGSLAKGIYNYRIVFVDATGNEGASSDPTASITIAGAPLEGGIQLNSLPSATGSFVTRRIYRSEIGGISPYTLVAEIDGTSTSFLDDGFTQGGILDASSFGVIRARLDARLKIDPGTVVKMEGARIEVTFGAQLMAEGIDGREVIFTSRLDDQFGAGGTFDTNNDDNRTTGENQPTAGDWGGLFFAPLSKGSIDHAYIAYGGGVNKIEGTTKAFNVIEVHQADFRLTHSVVENNATGIGGQGPLDRFGRGYNLEATIFARGVQPIIVDNTVRNNLAPFMTINANSLTYELLADYGRSTGFVDRIVKYSDNRGPLVRENRLDNNGINGMIVRGEVLTTQSVWDDTDVVHVLTDDYDNNNLGRRFDEIVIPNFHTFGGLRLQSSPVESLVIKLDGPGNADDAYNTNPTNGAGFTATGNYLEIQDRVGGVLHVVGQPEFPVVFTSINDDSVGAGVKPDNTPQTDTGNDGNTRPQPNDWRSLRLDQFSHDRNVEIILEQESPASTAPGINASVATAQFLGELSPDENSGDDNLRRGFEIQGLLNETNDIDTYSFLASAGTEVWLDIDRTSSTLDTVIEVLDASGNIIARSDNSLDETLDPSLIFRSANTPPGQVNPLQKAPAPYAPEHASGLPKDFFSTNPHDAGIRVFLSGNAGTRSTYFFRVRSKDGLTSGSYQLQLRTREEDEFPGSTVRFADIRFAMAGVEVIGLPAHSPLLGEAAEDELTDPTLASNNSSSANPLVPGQRPQDLGNLFATDRAVLSVAGSLSGRTDVDFYEMDVAYPTIVTPSTHHGSVVFDIDYADALARPNSTVSVFDSAGRLVLIGRDSNIAEDRPGPLKGADLADLSRGTVGTGDPFIGPVELPQGTYSIAVTSNGILPTALSNSLVRLEPIDTVLRIAEDHIDTSGGSTALPPVVPQLLDPTFVGTGGNLWHVTSRRAADSGHGLRPAFDGSRPGLGAAGSQIEIEPNNTRLTAQNIDGGPWLTSFNTNIGNTIINTSTSIPHISVLGTGNGTVDFYSFTVTQPNSRAIFDIDFGDTGPTDPSSFDSTIILYDSAGNVVSFNDDSLTSFGQNGSISNSDSYLELTIATPGTYYVAVGQAPLSFGPTGATSTPIDPGKTYTLQISLENHSVNPGGGGTANGGRSFFFGNESGASVPAGSAGSLLSNPFSLKGYSAEDLPTLYFNYFLNLNVNQDFFRVFAVESGGATTLLASSNPADTATPGVATISTTTTNWQQMRLPLTSLAGKENLRLRFDFQRPAGSTGTAEGAYVDDLIIGFAERGEMVVDAPLDLTTFSNNPAVPFNTTQVLNGPYQLEMRRSSDFGQSSSTGLISLVLDRTIDTNDRLAQESTLLVPSGAQVMDGQTFVISDGVNSVTFEYDDPSIPGGVTPGNIEVRFKSFDATTGMFVNDPDYLIARRIRDAVNSQTVQSRLAVTAAMSDGELSGVTSTSNRVNLFGNAIVEQPAAFQVTQVTTNANQLRDAIIDRNRGITPLGNATLVSGANSAALFEGGRASIGLDGGVILSTGDARFANGPNEDDGSTGRSSQSGDAQLNTEFGLTSPTTTDATSLAFNFQFGDGLTSGNHLYLNFIFASEEYNEYANAGFGDVMAIFVDGKNIGLLPTTPAPGTKISVNNVNGGNPLGTGAVNGNFYVNNDPSNSGRFLSDFGYDGFTTRLQANTLLAFPGGLSAGPHTIKIVVSDVGDATLDSAVLIETGSVATAPTPLLPQGIPSVRHVGIGDQNVFRDQGQVLIHSNTISNSRDFGILADAADRDNDSLGRPVLAPHPGPVRNLRELNNQANTGAKGGITPGVVIANNTLIGNDLGGIHVSGDTRALELNVDRHEGPTEGFTNLTAGDAVCDGDGFRLTVGRQTIEFEFEDISGSGANDLTKTCSVGSGAAGGNGWTPGRVPILYRRTSGTAGFSQFQMANAIAAAINNSTLVTNGTSQVAEVTVAPSLARFEYDITDNKARDWAVYVENAQNFSQFLVSATRRDPSSGLITRVVSIGNSAQPFYRVVNNTVFGDDGRYSFSPDAPIEPNDSIANAVDTRQGPAANPEFYRRTNLTLGDSQNFVDPRLDVDFYQFQLDIGDRVTVDVDAATINSPLDAVLRIFNSRGEELAINDDASPGNPGAGTIDPFLSFTATTAGTYFVAVSGKGNTTYDALSLGSRVAANSSGNYNIDINVWAPRRWVIDTRGLVNSGTSTFTIANVNNQQGSVSVTSTSTAPNQNTGAVAGSIAGQINLLAANGIVPNVSAQVLGGGTGARYVVIEGAAVMTGPQLMALNTNNENEILRETGILISEEATPTLVNNVLANLRDAVVEVEHQPAFLAPDGTSPRTTVQTGQLFQYNTGAGFAGVQMANMTVSTPGTTANAEVLTTLVDNSDFNIPLATTEPLFVNPLDGDLFPARFAKSIDSSIDTVPERNQLITVKSPMGIGLSPILAPDLDSTGQLRVDDPEVDTPQGQGGNVFKDRGSLDRSDFVGPSAVLLDPRDNDANGVDRDPTKHVVQVSSGVFSRFLVQLVDGFESSDPFPGVGVNDDTVSGRPITVEENGVDFVVHGPAISLFQDGKFLQEGLDYTFSYDTTSNTIVLTPLAGLWPSDKTYVIRLNNRDRFVIDAPLASALNDKDSFTITSATGNTAVFEFDRGYSMLVPVTAVVQVPREGAGPGGIVDGERLIINQAVGLNRQNIVFEFDKNTTPNILPGNLRIDISTAVTQDEVANAIVNALVTNLGLGARNLGNGRVHLGLQGTQVVDVDFSKLTQPGEMLSLLVPAVGVGPAGVQDGQTFTLSDGVNTNVFEFDANNILNTPGNFRVNIQGVTTANGVANAIVNAFTPLAPAPVPTVNMRPFNLGGGVVFLGATATGTATIQTAVNLNVVGAARLIGDGESFSIQNGANPPVVFEFDYSNGVAAPTNVPIIISTANTQDDIANAIVVAVRNAGVGLNPLNLGNGEIHLGGNPTQILSTTLAPSLKVPTTPGVTGPIRMQVPAAGGNAALGGIRDGDRFVVDNRGVLTTFEFNLDTDPPVGAGITPILFQLTNSQDQIANAIVAALRNANLGLNPVNLGSGLVDIGGTFNHQLNLLNNLTLPPAQQAPVLIKTGVPGGAIPIVFTPIPQFNVARSIIDSINQGILGGVSASLRGGSTLFVDFVDANGNVADFVNSLAALTTGNTINTFFLPAITDLPGNRLKPNQATNETEFTILLPGVALDFGDAPDPLPGPGGPGRYPTLFANNGARHVITTNPLTLGSRIDADNDGQPSIGAVGDDVDHQFNIAASNLSLTGTAPFTVRIPAAGGGAGGIVNGETFTITPNGGTPVRFEFNQSAAAVMPGNRGIIYATTDTADVLAGKMVAAIIAANLGLTPSAQGGGVVHIGGSQIHSFDVSNSAITAEGLPANLLRVPPGGGNDLIDGQTIVISDGRFRKTFEFDAGNGVSDPTHAVVGFSPADTPTTVAQSLIAAIQGQGMALTLTSLGNGVIHVEGLSSHLLDISSSTLRFTGQAPVRLQTPGAALSIQVPRIQQILVPSNVGAGVFDGDKFVINDGINDPVTFEFDAPPLGTTGSGNVPITFTSSNTQDELANAIVTAINGAIMTGLLEGLTPSNAGGGVVNLLNPANGEGANISLAISPTNTGTLGQSGPVRDGDLFVVSDGLSNSVTFEFESGGGTTGTPIPFTPADTVDRLANAIIAAVSNAASLVNVQAVNLTRGVVEFRTGVGATLSIPSMPIGSRLTSAGVGGGVADGQVMVVNNGNSPQTFEFDRNGLFALGNIPIPFSANSTPDDVANSIISALTGAGLEVTASPLGGGLIDINADDEDGVLIGGVFNRSVVPGTRITVISSGDGFIDGWVDFNADGDWDDPGEKILDSVAVVAGANSFNITIPPSATLITDSTNLPAVTYARFRLSSTGRLTPVGLAVDGEVEDYQVTIVPGTPPVVNPGVAVDVYTTSEDVVLNIAAPGVLGNDTDAENDPLTAVLRSPPNNGSVVLNPSGSFTYTPNADFNGVDVFTYQAFDGVLLSNNTGTVTITVREVNDAPTAANDTFLINEDPMPAFVIPDVTLLQNDTRGPANESSQTLTVVGTPTIISPPGGSISHSNGQVTYQPPADYNGVALIQYIITDDGTTSGVPAPLTATATITVFIQPVNDPPQIGNDTRVATEDIPFNVDINSLLANDLVGPPTAIAHDESGQVLAFDGVVNAANQVGGTGVSSQGGTVTVSGSFIRYVPPAEFSGIDTFRYVIHDNGTPNAFATGTVTISVIEVNDPPIAGNDSLSATEDTTTTYAFSQLLANDLPGPGNELPPQQTLTIAGFGLIGSPTTTAMTSQGGTVVLDATNQRLTYTPPANYNGSDSFTYVIQDNGTTNGVPAPERAVGTVTISVVGVNDPPVPQTDFVVGEEDKTSTIATSTLLANDSPGPGETEPITITSVATSTPGALVQLSGLQVLYRPPANFFGNDTFTYVVSDGSLTATGTVSISVQEVNDPPIPTNDSFTNWNNPTSGQSELINEDTTVSFAFSELTGNDAKGPANESGQTLTITDVAMTAGSAGAGSVSISGGRVVFTPTADFFGNAVFTYTVRDNGTSRGVSDPLSATGTVTLTVAPVNDPPVAVNKTFTVAEDTVLDITRAQLLAGDVAGPLNERTTQTLRVVQALSLSPPSQGSVSLSPSGTVTFTPATDFNGVFTFFYEVADDGSPNRSAFGTVTISVTPVNDPPIAIGDQVNAAEDQTLTINSADLLANDLPGPLSATDEAGQQLFITQAAYSGPNGSTVTVASDGSTITYRPGANFNGVDTFTYLVWDGVGDPTNPQNLAIGTVTVTVSEVNDAPVVANDSRTTAEDTALTIIGTTLTANDQPGPTNEPAATAIKESTQTLRVVTVGAASSRGGTVTYDGNTDTVIYTPPTNFNSATGLDTFTYVVEDNGTTAGANDFRRTTGTVTVSITPVNDLPIPGADTVSTNEDTPLSVLEGNLLSNDLPGPADEAGQLLTLISVAPTSLNGGTITRAGATILYTPPQNFNGVDSFTYVVEDNGTTNNVPDAKRNTGTVIVSVAPVNDPPFVANQPAAVNVSEDPVNQPIQVNLAGVFGDPDIVLNNDSLSLSIANNSRPSLVTASIVGTTLNLNFLPNQNGSAVIAVRATDSVGASVTANVSINVSAVNDPPILANAIADFSVNEDAPNTVIELFPTVFDDPDVVTNNDQLTIRVVSNSNSSLISTQLTGTQLTLDYLDNQSGSATIVLEASDLAGQTRQDTFVVTVLPVNDPPVAVSDTYMVNRGQSLIINDALGTDSNPLNNGILFNDNDIDNPKSALQVLLVSNVLNGSLSLNSNGTFTYTHNNGSTTQDSFSYRVSDGQALSNVATVTLNISNPFQNPTNRFDVNNDGSVSPVDALLVINHINRIGTGPLPPGFTPPPFVDVSGNGEVSATDISLVIGELNRLAGGTGEGESFVAAAFSQPTASATLNSSLEILSEPLDDSELESIFAMPAIVVGDSANLRGFGVSVQSTSQRTKPERGWVEVWEGRLPASTDAYLLTDFGGLDQMPLDRELDEFARNRVAEEDFGDLVDAALTDLWE